MKTRLGNKRVAFLGAGNMAEALVKGLLRSRVAKPAQLEITDIRPERLAYFKKQFGVAGRSDNAAAVSRADIAVLAVKPQQLTELLQEIRSHIRSRTRVISIAAGFRTARIESLLPHGTAVVRAMPNTPALVGAGVSAICAGTHARAGDLALAECILGAVGRVVRVKEADMDAVTALSGSGPAYVFYFVEALLRAAKAMKFSAANARMLVEDTFRGAAQLLSETGEEPGVLRERVTSKGGTTAAALAVLEAAGVGNAIERAVLAAQQRSKELSAM
jgi:pyrroline-5-carboxylate reductase